MGNFEKLSVLVIVVIIVMILVVALYTWTGDPSGGDPAAPIVAPQPKEIARQPITIPVREEPKKGLDAEAILDQFRKTGMQPKPIVDVPTPPDIEVPPAPKEPKSVTVASGETIAKIAKREYPGRTQQGIDAILKANPTVEPSRMREGTKLTIPELAVEAKPADGVAPTDTRIPISRVRRDTACDSKANRPAHEMISAMTAAALLTAVPICSATRPL